MFFCPELLRKKGHPFFVVWIAATQGGDTLKKYLTVRKVAGVDLCGVVEEVMQRIIVNSSISRRSALHDGCLSLYLSAQLMYGCCVVLDRKASRLVNDCVAFSRNLRKIRFSSEKSQLVLQFPMKSNSIESNNVTQAPVKKPTSSILNFLELLHLGDNEDLLDFSTHSVPEHTITMIEVDPCTSAMEDTRFGDEGDGGLAFTSYLNELCGPESAKMVSVNLSDNQEQQGHFDERVPVDHPELQASLPGGIAEVPLDEAAPTVLPETEHVDVDAIAPNAPQDLEPNIVDPLAPNLLQDLETGLAAPDVLHETEQPGPVVDSALDFLQNLASSLVDDAVPNFLQDLEPTHADDAVPNFLQDLEPTLADDAVPNFLQDLEPTHADEADPLLVPGQADETAQIVLPGQEQPSHPDGIRDARSEDIPEQSSLIEEESDLMVLPELREVPRARRIGKRPPRLIIDEKTQIPSAVLKRRIDQKGSDTLSYMTSYEDSMLMHLKAKWLNLDSMKQPSRMGNINRSLRTLFSRQLVTYAEPDDPDSGLDTTGQSEESPSSKKRKSASPMADERGENLPKRRRTASAGSEPMEMTLQGQEPTFTDVARTQRGTTLTDETITHLQDIPGFIPFTDGLQDEMQPTQLIDLGAINETRPPEFVDKLQDQIQTLGDADPGLMEGSRPTDLMDNSLSHEEPSSKRRRTASAGSEPMEMTLQGQEPTLTDVARTQRETTLTDETRAHPQEIPDSIPFIDDLQDEIQPTESIDLGAINETRPPEFVDKLQDQIQTLGGADPGLMEGSRPTGTSPQPYENVPGENLPQDSVSTTSASSLRPTLTQDVLASASELAHERNASTFPISDLCPPAGTKRLKAAAVFGALLDLHKTRNVSLRQDGTMASLFVTVNELT